MPSYLSEILRKDMFTNDLPSQEGHNTNRITIAFLTCFHACFDQSFGVSLVVDARGPRERVYKLKKR